MRCWSTSTPSPRSTKRPDRHPGRVAGGAGQIPAALAAALVAACAGVEAPAPPSPALSPEVRPFVVSPLEGLEGAVPYADERLLLDGHRDLVVGGDPLAARSAATTLLERDPSSAPARVLSAQIFLAEGDPAGAVEETAAVVQARPAYTAAALVHGRGLEELDRIVEAALSYASVADANTLAAASVERLREAATAALAGRAEDALARGRLDLAGTAVESLELLAPGRDPTLDAILALAEAEGRDELALTAARELARRRPGDPELLGRWADLELAAGDAGEGLRVFEELVAAYPEEPAWQERAERARFRWRMTLLPEEIGELARKGELTRGEFAAMIYWLFPNVRYGRQEGAVIASDILEDPWRREIARVVNLGILDVEAGVHAFHPSRPVERREALEAVVRLAALGSPPPVCLGEGVPARLDVGSLCAMAAACGLIEAEGECLPAAPVAGAEAVDLAQGGLELVGR